MKTFYIEKLDKHRFTFFRTKIENDSFRIYTNLEKAKNIKKVINNNPDSSVISEYLKFLHEENRFEDLLDVYRKQEKLNMDIVKPYILNEYT